MTSVPEQEYPSWDAFWAEVAPELVRTETIRGVKVEIPSNLPLSFDQRMAAAASEVAIRALLAEIFGTDVLDKWTKAGMGHLELQVVLTWAVANGQGRATGYREAYDLVRNAGKAPAPANREERRAAVARKPAAPRPSAATGGRSKPTSSASTTSTRKRSAS